jgi:SAM-dependent methyltransferase
LRLRGRLTTLSVLEAADAPADPRYAFVTAAGVDLNEATQRAAGAFAQREGLDVVDLVPGDLPVERCLHTLRLINPATYRKARLADGRGGFQALLVTEDVLRRARIEERRGLDPAAMLRVTAQLKFYACASTDLAVAPSLTASADDPGRMLAWWRQLVGGFAPMALLLNVGQLVFLLVGPCVRPLWGTLALVAYCLQPSLIFTGTALAPRDLAWQLPLRPLRGLRTWLHTVFAPDRPAQSVDPIEAARPVYKRLLASGTARLFEPRRNDCPLCGSAGLRGLIRVGDWLQYKPGEFTLERCTSCGHVFQNPRLSVEGLDFYYKDFYDGMGEGITNVVFNAAAAQYGERARVLVGHADPKTWLDVGTGHGHFCCVARDVWPQTRFDGLDMSESIEEAARRGWVDRGFRGRFVDTAAEIEGAYDVVSMHHYLEHTREPLAELAAAARVVRSGGHLVVELPDPESALARWLGKYWIHWFQPQHQQFFSIGNLRAALGRLGLRTVAVERAGAHQAIDLSVAALALIQQLAPPVHLPWRPADGARWRQLGRSALFAVAWPLIILGLIGDAAIKVIIHRSGAGSNTYRLLARKEGSASVIA